MDWMEEEGKEDEMNQTMSPLSYSNPLLITLLTVVVQQLLDQIDVSEDHSTTAVSL